MNRVCMVTYSFYESDNRIIRYAETLAGRGDEVHVLSLRSSPASPDEERSNGVRVHRLQDRFGKCEGSRWSFLWPLMYFTWLSSCWLIANRKLRFDLVHVHNIPDFLVFSAWYAKLRGARVILDIHDVVPEFFASKFRVSHDSMLVRALLLMEKASAAMADRIILSNHLWLDKYAARSAQIAKCTAVINHVDEAVFHPLPRRRTGAERVIVFPGGLQWHQGLDIAIRAFSLLCRRVPDTRFDIYGDGSMKQPLLDLIGELKLEGRVRIHDPVKLTEVARIMADADLGVVPKRADSFGDEAYSTKIMEFMAVGVPVVVSSTRVDRHYFDDSVVRFFPSGDHEALADAMQEMLCDSVKRQAMLESAGAYVKRHGWSNHKRTYLELVDRLLAAPVSSASSTA